MEYKFTIKLKPITKKNSQQIVKDKTGRPRIVPSSAYKKYEKQCEKFMPDGCFGCIAEDMAKIIPSCVNGDVDCADDDAAAIQGIGIDYSKLVPHLIKMVQIQQAQIDAQQEQINNLASQIL